MWYNYWSETELKIQSQNPPEPPLPPLYYWYELKAKGYSSHDYIVFLPIPPRIWEDLVIVKYQGIPRELTFKARFNTTPDNP